MDLSIDIKGFFLIRRIWKEKIKMKWCYTEKHKALKFTLFSVFHLLINNLDCQIQERGSFNNRHQYSVFPHYPK